MTAQNEVKIPFNSLRTVVTLRNTRSVIQTFFVLSTKCIYVLFYGSQNK